MLSYALNQTFVLEGDASFDTSTCAFEVKKGSLIEIIEIDEGDEEAPYKVYFHDAQEWLYLSQEELATITEKTANKFHIGHEK